MIERSFRLVPEGYQSSFESQVLAAKQRRNPGWEKQGEAALTELFRGLEENFRYVANQVARSLSRGHDDLFIEDCLSETRVQFVTLLDELNLDRLPAGALRSAFYNDRLTNYVRSVARRRLSPVSISEHADLTVGRIRRREESIGRELEDAELREFEISRSTLAAARAASARPIGLEEENEEGERYIDSLADDSWEEPRHDWEAVMAVFDELPARFQLVLEAFCGRHGDEHAGNLSSVAGYFSEVTGREIGDRRIRQWFGEVMGRMRARLGCGSAQPAAGVSIDDRGSSEMWDVLATPHLRGFGLDEDVFAQLFTDAGALN